jgi:hypothetical protein
VARFGLRLTFELRAWRREGRVARLWWRDDDARGMTPALGRLLALSDRFAVPLTLAVVPEGPMAGLGEAVAQRPGVRLALHGVDHRNRRDGPAAGEFPHAWTRAEVVARLQVGWNRLRGQPGATCVFIPPWNDVHPALSSALALAGFRGWSAWGEIESADPLPRIDAHLDLLRWRGGVRFRGAGRLERALAKALRARRLSGRGAAPLGRLTHHLDHDQPAWRHLERLLAAATAEPSLAWWSLDDLLGARDAKQAA